MERILLSIDVGIVNLSYCILNKNTNEIIDWTVINLKDIKCEECDNTAIYEQDKKFYCSNCYIKPPIEDFFVEDKSTICIKCGKKGRYSRNDNGYCLIHAKQLYNSELFPITTIKKGNFNITIINLISKLKSIKLFDIVNNVVIENQPSYKNPVMKSISMALYTYFTLKDNVKKVSFISPGLKLKNISDIDKSLLKQCNKSKKYKFTKELSIKYCIDNLNDEKWHEFLVNHNKKDDLADSYLHAINH